MSKARAGSIVRALTLVAALCAVSAPLAAAPIQVRVAVESLFDMDRVPLCVALSNGWFESERISVALVESRGSAARLAAVAGSKADISWAPAVEILAERARGKKLQIVGALGDRHPACVFFRADPGIASPGDLAGKILAVRPFTMEALLLPLMAENTGVRIEDISPVSLDPAAAVTALASGSVDAMLGTLGELATLDQAFAPASLSHILWAEHGFDLYGECYVVRDASASGAGSKGIAAFLSVMYKAWEYSLSNPEEAAAAAAELCGVDPVMVSLELARWSELYATDAYRTAGIGSMDPTRMGATVRAATALLGIPASFSLESAYSVSLLPSPPVLMKEEAEVELEQPEAGGSEKAPEPRAEPAPPAAGPATRGP